MKTLSYCRSEAELQALLKRSDKVYLSQLVAFWHGVVRALSDGQFPVLLSIALYGEARGEREEGQRAVFEVIANRAVRDTDGLIDNVLLCPLQFSCFNPGDISLQSAMLVNEDTVKEYTSRAYDFVHEWNSGRDYRVVNGATMYCTLNAASEQFTRYLLGKPGAWNFSNMRRVAVVGKHVFFEEV
jgi:hypothetical protein